MLRAQMRRHGLGVNGFVETCFIEANRERLDRTRRLRLHQGHHRGRVNAARQKGAQRHVGHHLLAHRNF